MEVRPDLNSRTEIVRLVDAFYERVRADAILGPIFNDVADVDWATHLPKMYDFWDSVLFGTPGFKGDPLDAHRKLAMRVPLGEREFARWLMLFNESVDALLSGPQADDVKRRAARIASVMQHHIQAAHH